MRSKVQGQTSGLIRLAVAADAERIASVLEASFAEFRHLYTARAFRATVVTAAEVLRRMNEGPIWLAEERARAVGTLSGVPTDSGLYLRGMAASAGGQGPSTGQVSAGTSRGLCTPAEPGTTVPEHNPILDGSDSRLRALRPAKGRGAFCGSAGYTPVYCLRWRSGSSDGLKVRAFKNAIP